MKRSGRCARFSLRNKPLRALTDRWDTLSAYEGLGKSGLHRGKDTRECNERHDDTRNLCRSVLALFTVPLPREIAMRIGLRANCILGLGCGLTRPLKERDRFARREGAERFCFAARRDASSRLARDTASLMPSPVCLSRRDNLKVEKLPCAGANRQGPKIARVTREVT